MQIKQSQKRFYILIAAVSVSGFSQGLLLPLLSVLLEKEGISSAFNGLSSSALYIGMLVASPFMVAPVQKYGYKPILIFGVSLVTISIALFPVWTNYYFWILLRFIVGIGDNAIHYASQLWITTSAEPRKRGRSISMYGFAYGLGFAIGPVGLALSTINYNLPFIISICFFLTVLIFILKIKNEKPETAEDIKKEKGYFKIIPIAGIALMPIFIYGFLESTLNVSFPIYGLRTSLNEGTVSLLLSSFAIGGLIFQLPLGRLSDYIGRKRILIGITLIGGLIFSMIPLINSTPYLLIAFVLAGGFTGSLFSLGLAYMTDLLQPSQLPKANIFATIVYGIASMIAPYLCGLSMDIFNPESIFYMIAFVILIFTFVASITSILNFRKSKKI